MSDHLPLHIHGESVGGLADVVHSPERFKARREGSPYEVIVTVRIAGVLLRGVVGTRVGWVLGRILLLAVNICKPKV